MQALCGALTTLADRIFARLVYQQYVPLVIETIGRWD